MAEEQTLVVEGTGDSQHLLREIAAAFNADHKGRYRVEIPDSIGSSGGIQAVITNRTPLGRIARSLKDKERARGLDYVAFAFSPIVVVVHPGVEGVEGITGAQLISVYAGKIRNWKALGGRDGKIYPIDREPGDSSRTVLEKTVPGFKDIAFRQTKVFFTTPETVGALSDNANTIGYAPLSAVQDTDLQVLSLNGISPDADSIRENKYPHTVNLGLVFKPPLNGISREFVDFVTSEAGQRIMENFGAIPTGSAEYPVN